ncbi:MAG TPA: Hpt domain-containing protein [Rhodanobacteraceae bacterium]|nr:Hpt domain-containing protein [Rhodanobacteraceae bacterium]
MKLQEDIDFTTLTWVKQELDETLKQARQALEAYVEDPADASLMRFCATYLHQVQGTLRMVELYGASMVVEEMERLAQAILDGEVKQKDEAYSVLMRGIVQLPDYLERLQSGHKDIPIVLLPLLNDLRAVRGEELFSESVLFSPDLGAPLPEAAAGAAQALPDLELKAQTGRLRTVYQVSLLKWLRQGEAADAQRLQDVLQRLQRLCHAEEPRRLWWVGAALLEGVQTGGVQASPAVKLLFGKVDREIKRLVDAGEASFRTSPPRELVKNLLYYVAHGSGGGPLTAEVRRTYALDALMPSQRELEHAKGSISGHNRALLDTVSAAIKDDLLRVKEALDIFLRNTGNDPAELSAQAEVLDRVGDTLGMLGLGVPRRVVLEQRTVVEEIAAKSRAADESTLLDVAGALLYVEASLDDHIDRLGAETPEGEGSGGMELPKAEVRKILDALMKEASANLAQAKHDIVAFVESPWDHAKVEQIPKLLEDVGGALRMLDLPKPAELMHGVVRFIEVELLRWRRVPTAEQMDKLADAVASIEYYLEATRDQRAGREKILDVTRQSLESLGYWPVPPDDGLLPEPPPATAAPLPTAPTAGGTPVSTVPVPTSGEAARGQATPAPAAAAAAVVAPAAAAAAAAMPAFVDLAAADRAAASEFPAFGADALTTSGKASLQMDSDATAAGDDHELPSIELTPDSDIDAYIARLGLGEAQEQTPAPVPTPALPEAPSAEPELREVVQIARGEGLDALVVGTTPPTEPAPQDLTGLRLTPTEPTATPPVQAPQVRYVEVEEEIEEEVPDTEGAAAPAADASFQAVGSDDIDEEIREVFVEEVQEEIENLQRHVPLWKGDASNLENLKPVRRSFHTLKGSGRLVGALALGEFSWKVENMLNRVLDKTIPPGPSVQALVDHAIGALPGLLGALRGEGAPTADIAGIMGVADRLAAGEDAWLAPAKPRTRKVKRVVKRMVAVPVEPEPAPAVATQAPAAPAPQMPVAELTETFHVTEALTLSPEEEAVAAGAPEAPGAGPLPNIDPVLFDILRSEVSQHLASVDAYIAACSPVPQPATDTLLRAVHTLHGAIAMVDIPVIGHVLAPLEGYIKRLRGGDQAPDATGLAVLRDASALVASVMAELEKPQPHLPDADALVERVCALRDVLPEPELAHKLYDVPVEEESPSEAPAAGAPVDLPSSVVEAAAVGISDLDGGEELVLSTSADSVAMVEAEVEAAAEEPLVEAEEIGFEDLVDSDLLVGVEGRFETPAVAAPPALASADQVTQAQMEQEWQASAAEETLQSLDQAQLHEALAAEANPAPVIGEADIAEFERALAAEAAALPSEPESVRAPPASGVVLGDADIAEFERMIAAEAQLADAHAGESSRLELPEEAISPAAEAPSVALPAEEAAVSELDWLASQVSSEHIDLGTPTAEPALPATVSSPAPVVAQPPPAEIVAAAEPEAAQAPQEIGTLVPIAEDPQPEGKLDLPDMDEDLLEIFVQEGTDILDHSDSLMARLRESSQDRELVTGLQRDLHTLKGGARMAGLAPIGDLSHAMESLLEAVSEGRRSMDRGSVESFERGFDLLHALVQRVARRQAIAMPDHAIGRFEDLVNGKAIPTLESEAAAAPAPAPLAPVAAPAAPAAVEAEAPARQPGPARPAAPVFEEEAHAPQEMIRVRSDLLDSLVNYAGEVSIYRSRLEQQVSTFRFNLIEFEQTVGRLREQLRKMEIETETQIIARYQREHHEAGEQAFDPLELDRFSQMQQLSRALAESVSDLMSIQGLLDDLTRQSETLLLQQSRVSSDLQEGLMRTRMVPFDSLVPSLRRTLRQAAQEVGKRAQLKVEGAQGEMDRNLLERMKAPFEHMLRNALAHGIEDPAARRDAGKSEEGSVVIQVSREATEVVIRVTDDGRGFNRDAIRKKAIERGLLKPDAQLSDRDLYAFVLETGFSTAEQVTQLAGRGVGMDVVNNEIKQLGGSLTIDSERGKGTVFTIRLPFTLAVTQAILVRLGESTYAIPMSSVQGVVRITREDLDQRLASGRPVYSYAGEEFTIYDLAQLLGVPGGRAVVEDTQLPLLMTRTGDQRAAVRIDAVIGSREVVVKSVGPQISSVPGIFGATIMGDGSVVMILDLAPLVRRSAALRERVAEGEAIEASTILATPVVEVEERKKPLVMVVDDSITMRKVTTRVLERNDLEVVTAKDGLDAVEKLQDKVPDVMLLDIEMPRMDGYELATYMKNDPRLRLVPIIMITSRTGEKHRQRALEIGVERYLGKPYQEADLLRNVQETLTLARAGH